MDTNSKKTIELFMSFHGFWSQKDKNLSFDRADRGLAPIPVICALPAERSSIENKLGLSYNFFFLLFFLVFWFKFVYYPTGFVCSNRLHQGFKIVSPKIKLNYTPFLHLDWRYILRVFLEGFLLFTPLLERAFVL